MKMSKRRQQSTTDGDGCRTGRRPSPEARARHDDAIAQASLRRMFRTF